MLGRDDHGFVDISATAFVKGRH